MERSRACLTTLAGSALIATAAEATFSHGRVRVVDQSDGLTTFRYVLVFDHPNDALLEVGGVPGVASFEFEADASLFNDGGPFEGLKPGDFPGLGGPRDSWVTIGGDQFAVPVDYTADFAGVPTFLQAIEGCCFSEPDGVWFDTDPRTPVTGQPAGACRFEILIAQLTLPIDADFTMSGVLRYRSGADGSVAVGYFETPLTPPICPGDLDCSGETGFTDLLALLASWGPCPSTCPADLDGDGAVGFADLLTLLAHWGPCP